MSGAVHPPSNEKAVKTLLSFDSNGQVLSQYSCMMMMMMMIMMF
jgi:hypothetical protein